MTAGVPEISQAVGFKVSPAGSAGEIEQEVSAPPLKEGMIGGRVVPLMSIYSFSKVFAYFTGFHNNRRSADIKANSSADSIKKFFWSVCNEIRKEFVF